MTGAEAFLAVLTEWLESQEEGWLLTVVREGEGDAGEGAGTSRTPARDLPLRGALPTLEDQDPTRVEHRDPPTSGLAA